jgi:hypothetical protein
MCKNVNNCAIFLFRISLGFSSRFSSRFSHELYADNIRTAHTKTVLQGFVLCMFSLGVSIGFRYVQTTFQRLPPKPVSQFFFRQHRVFVLDDTGFFSLDNLPTAPTNTSLAGFDFVCVFSLGFSIGFRYL